ncbi:hypothetical protein [Mycolicibacterium moriokaense]|uniref:hypothetical protein n=1 Tax=Mycolicibacterium moriokaense TaxID=39691 RepID=UPI001055E5B3|nr:hypothetical protein [Mycolicibacterium moriokaense]MCV7040756.1 hypothetical protein [Mycolicibacterium moriokaense]
MATLTDQNGTVWTIKRRWWPFPNGLLDLTFGWVENLIALIFTLLWPFWLLAKFCGVRWVITVERDGERVRKELVRGWKKSKVRIDEIAGELDADNRPGYFLV